MNIEFQTKQYEHEGKVFCYVSTERSPMDSNNLIVFKKGEVLRKKINGFESYIKRALIDLKTESFELEELKELLSDRLERLDKSSEAVIMTKKFIQQKEEIIKTLNDELEYFRRAERELPLFIESNVYDKNN